VSAIRCAGNSLFAAKAGFFLKTPIRLAASALNHPQQCSLIIGVVASSLARHGEANRVAIFFVSRIVGFGFGLQSKGVDRSLGDRNKP